MGCRQVTEQPMSLVRIESLINLTTSPIVAEAEDTQIPLNAYIIPGIALY